MENLLSILLLLVLLYLFSPPPLMFLCYHYELQGMHLLSALYLFTVGFFFPFNSSLIKMCFLVDSLGGLICLILLFIYNMFYLFSIFRRRYVKYELLWVSFTQNTAHHFNVHIQNVSYVMKISWNFNFSFGSLWGIFFFFCLFLWIILSHSLLHFHGLAAFLFFFFLYTQLYYFLWLCSFVIISELISFLHCPQSLFSSHL